MQSETRTLRQQSMSMPSRLVSIFRLSDRQVVHAGGEDAEPAAVLDGEVAQGDVAAQLQGDGLVALPPAAGSRLAPVRCPQMRPGPTMATFLRFSPQIRLLCQWVWPKSW